MNKGLEASEVARIKEECKKAGKSFIFNEGEERGEEFASFYFVGRHEGKEVVFDAFMYTLEMEYASRTYDMAHEMVLSEFPEFADADFDQEEGEHIDQLERAMAEVEEEGTAKVSESLEIDDSCDYGVELTVCLKIPEVKTHNIEDFVKSFNEGNFHLNKNLYSFEPDSSEE